MAVPAISQFPGCEERLESRWSFLNEQSGACSVVTRKMEVLYLNQTARSLVPPQWMGRRCWEVFPVGTSSCAARCPAVKAVSMNDGIAYCEETIYPGGTPLPLGVAVIPLGAPGKYLEQAVLLIRPKNDQLAPEAFKEQLLRDAESLRSLCLYCAFED
jgi:hypothetical protein